MWRQIRWGLADWRRARLVGVLLVVQILLAAFFLGQAGSQVGQSTADLAALARVNTGEVSYVDLYQYPAEAGSPNPRLERLLVDLLASPDVLSTLTPEPGVVMVVGGLAARWGYPASAGAEGWFLPPGRAAVPESMVGAGEVLGRTPHTSVLDPHFGALDLTDHAMWSGTLGGLERELGTLSPVQQQELLRNLVVTGAGRERLPELAAEVGKVGGLDLVPRRLDRQADGPFTVMAAQAALSLASALAFVGMASVLLIVGLRHVVRRSLRDHAVHRACGATVLHSAMRLGTCVVLLFLVPALAVTGFVNTMNAAFGQRSPAWLFWGEYGGLVALAMLAVGLGLRDLSPQRLVQALGMEE